MTPLRHHREKSGLSLKKMASALNINPGTLSRIETGGEDGRYRTSLETAERIARYFDKEITEEQILYPDRFTKEGVRLESHSDSSPSPNDRTFA